MNSPNPVPKKIAFYCVLKSGKRYGATHVQKLKQAVERHCSLPFTFHCLSDCEVPCDRIPLVHEWPTFWSKVELFRAGVTDPDALNVYLDLDVLVAGNLDEFVSYPHRFSMARDNTFTQRANSSVMAWTGDHSYIYEEMRRRPMLTRMRFCSLPWYGDQGLTEYCLLARGAAPDRIDDLFPDCFRIYRTLGANDNIDEGALFVSFQGCLAKPGSAALADDPLIQKYW